MICGVFMFLGRSGDFCPGRRREGQEAGAALLCQREFGMRKWGSRKSVGMAMQLGGSEEEK